jgi:NAD(P)-dependent dehydrogenase (short-subunit alcohol dehydrogenase family)
LKGVVVLVTGAAQGIGLSTSLSFLKAGATVIMTSRSLDRVQAAAEEARKTVAASSGRGVAHALCLDVLNELSISKAANSIAAEFGHIDVLVNNAGILDPPTPWSLVADSDAWWTVWETNLRGVSLTTKHFLPLITSSQASAKTIINVVSSSALIVRPSSSCSAYRVSALTSI